MAAFCNADLDTGVCEYYSFIVQGHTDDEVLKSQIIFALNASIQAIVSYLVMYRFRYQDNSIDAWY